MRFETHFSSLGLCSNHHFTSFCSKEIWPKISELHTSSKTLGGQTGSWWALFVFSLHCVTCLPAPPFKTWRCVSTQHFTLTRLTGCTGGSDKSLISVKRCHGFGCAGTPACGCTVAGTRVGGFFCPPPALHCTSVPRPCGAASRLPTFSHNRCTIACRGCAESTVFSPHYLTHE